MEEIPEITKPSFREKGLGLWLGIRVRVSVRVRKKSGNPRI
jgi:hypothetical protein